MKRDELYAAALRVVNGRRQQAVLAARRAQEDAERRLPQLRALEDARREAGIRTAKLAVTGAEECEREAARSAARQARETRDALLRENGIAPASLEPQYTCALCRDTGHTEQGVCTCVQQMVRELRRKELCEASPLTLCSFDTFDLKKYPTTPVPELGVTMREQMTQIYDYCRAWAQHFHVHAESLYLYGYAGLGKTHLALSIAGEVLRKGYDVVYLSAQEAFAHVEEERFGNGQGSETLRAMLDAELLVLDDLGTEFLTPYVGACLYDVINTRYNRRLPTIYTSNIVNDADLARRYTEKIVSRLLGGCEMLGFIGQDIRLQNR